MLDVAIVLCAIMLAYHSQQYILCGLLVIVTILWVVECFWDIWNSPRERNRREFSRLCRMLERNGK